MVQFPCQKNFLEKKRIKIGAKISKTLQKMIYA